MKRQYLVKVTIEAKGKHIADCVIIDTEEYIKSSSYRNMKQRTIEKEIENNIDFERKLIEAAVFIE